MKPLGRKQEKHLADVVLADAEWQQFQDRIHHAGISALVSATRNRRRRVRLANLAAIASIAFIVAGVYVATIHPSAHSTVSAAAPAVLSDKSSLPYISEQEVARIAKELSGSPSTIADQNRGPEHQIDTSKIRALGMTFGGEALLRQTIAELLRFQRS